MPDSSKLQSTGDEAREQCRVCLRALMHRLLAYARLQADADTDVEVLLSGVIERVVQAAAQGRVPVQEEDILRYCFSSIRHEAMRQRQRNVNRRMAESLYGGQDGVAPTEHHPRMENADAQLRAKLLRNAVRQLPPEQAELILLHIWQEISIAEIARRCSTPESTIRSRYTAALRAVKLNLNHSDIC